MKQISWVFHPMIANAQSMLPRHPEPSPTPQTPPDPPDPLLSQLYIQQEMKRKDKKN
ncbi:hypothetical protein BO70DRAFT_2056 [Aspergillus heteromorphus CBS 117.55]|uniref:Uncharacterized protein n=1 Tax=Aspergillus heteromorphus CBS 117.55 TaxID=1448321 RepID=A0A317X542_9EURO|nr:uncharacterized protein BO70DRAFT_2056 [Aspergillus heteromorphus CBS 117.55]PWY92068.1 hypothetical protein BO70DRAFT_2056 [Aspergillus heteromorphus CBS 117.55]